MFSEYWFPHKRGKRDEFKEKDIIVSMIMIMIMIYFFTSRVGIHLFDHYQFYYYIKISEYMCTLLPVSVLVFV